MLCFFCICLIGEPTQAQMLTGDLGKDAATLRLVAAPGLTSGSYSVGVEIVMTPGSHTYWKMPGDAGVPPVFSFEGSENVKAATVSFPTPKRIVEEGLEAFGYVDTVVFPVEVVPRDAGKPAVLHADVDYAVCNKICIPAHGKAEVALPSGATAEGGEIVARATTAVPAALSQPAMADLAIVPDATQPKPSWTVTWRGAQPITDIFAAAPEGDFFDTRETGPQIWRLTASQVVTAPHVTTVPVELTLARQGGGLVTTITLDVARPGQ